MNAVCRQRWLKGCQTLWRRSVSTTAEVEAMLQGELLVNEIKGRHRAVGARLPAGSVAILPAAQTLLVPGTQIPLPYRQEASFRYVTGIDEPDIIAALEVNPTGERTLYRLFVPEMNMDREQWEGKRISELEASDVYGADTTHSLSEFPKYIEEVANDRRSIFYNSKMWANHIYGKYFFGNKAKDINKRAGGKRLLYNDLENIVHPLRWQKSDTELELMRKSAQITSHAFKECMRKSHSYVCENDISALFEYECKLRGGKRMPYPQVVASGNNACTIHYSKNNRMALDGEMILMDAGCDVHGYASDVTRTWPVNGKFTEAQREVYELILEVHQKCVEACIVGSSLLSVHNMSVELLSGVLSKLGIVDNSTKDIVIQNLYKPYYPHSIGHWLGIDTHDVNLVSATKRFEDGVVLAIEPGLYLSNELHNVPPKYRGIGIRLEDVVAVHSHGPEILSSQTPIRPEQIEALVGSSTS